MELTSPTVYIAGSFKHKHGVRLLGHCLRLQGWTILDWTEKAVPPENLPPAERRVWMDTDTSGGAVYTFCSGACTGATLVIYYGASGQDAGVEVGLAHGAGVPVLGIRGPLESVGLMLNGAVDVWTEDVDEALAVLEEVYRLLVLPGTSALVPGMGNAATLAVLIRGRKKKIFAAGGKCR